MRCLLWRPSVPQWALRVRRMSLIGALDQGTTSTRFLIYDEKLNVVSGHQMEHRQITPQAGWVEHDPQELVANSRACIEAAVAALGDRRRHIKAVGFTNQRETTVLWDRLTGKPLCNAIVWSDVRTAGIVQKLAASWGGKDAMRSRCGLPLSTYFAATKVKWLLENHPEVKQAVQERRCLFGTVDSWLLYCFSGRQVHITDITNASRTMLMDINTGQWDPNLCGAFGIPMEILPKIRSNSETYCTLVEGTLRGVPIASSIGDQQAATVGQACFHPGQAKNTYGSGCFVLQNTGATPVQSHNGLLTTVCYQIGQQDRVYALEGAIANAGTVLLWLRDNFGIINSPSDCEPLAASVPDTGGVVFVPALSGLYAPYWRDDARGTILGLTQYSNKAHICRAALEGVCCLAKEVLQAMELDSGHRLDRLAVDGGMSRNNLMMQMQADILGATVVRAANPESTSMGCSMLAGLAVGIWKDVKELERLVAENGARTVWQPNWTAMDREAHFRSWQKALQKSFTQDDGGP
eukprot:GGOE01003365.1.p2 GENE.GGOE01003365.1~~GGOE01003365.1.p2  ORF type:complete len:522 (+),score=143.50 GGOE01003365.1:51-1616(+)